MPPHAELEFLHPLPVERLWGVGAVTAAKLHARGIRTVGEAARLPEEALVLMVGRAAGRQLHALAHNRDRRRVQVGRRRGSIGSQRALGRGRWSHDEVDATLVGLVDRITRRMRRAGRVGRTVVLRLRFDDFSRATRSTRFRGRPRRRTSSSPPPEALLAATWPTIRQRGLTLVGVSVANLESVEEIQLVLPLDGTRGFALDAAVDEIRDRFGSAAITRAVLLGRDPGLVVPLLPD